MSRVLGISVTNKGLTAPSTNSDSLPSIKSHILSLLLASIQNNGFHSDIFTDVYHCTLPIFVSNVCLVPFLPLAGSLPPRYIGHI